MSCGVSECSDDLIVCNLFRHHDVAPVPEVVEDMKVGSRSVL